MLVFYSVKSCSLEFSKCLPTPQLPWQSVGTLWVASRRIPSALATSQEDKSLGHVPRVRWEGCPVPGGQTWGCAILAPQGAVTGGSGEEWLGYSGCPGGVLSPAFYSEHFQTGGKVERTVPGRTTPRFYTEGFAVFITRLSIREGVGTTLRQELTLCSSAEHDPGAGLAPRTRCLLLCTDCSWGVTSPGSGP